MRRRGLSSYVRIVRENKLRLRKCRPFSFIHRRGRQSACVSSSCSRWRNAPHTMHHGDAYSSVCAEERVQHTIERDSGDATEAAMYETASSHIYVGDDAREYFGAACMHAVDKCFYLCICRKCLRKCAAHIVDLINVANDKTFAGASNLRSLRHLSAQNVLKFYSQNTTCSQSANRLVSVYIYSCSQCRCREVRRAYKPGNIWVNGGCLDCGRRRYNFDMEM